MHTSTASIFRNKDFNYAKYRLDLWNQDISKGIQPSFGLYRTNKTISVSDIHFAHKLLKIFSRPPCEYTLRIEGFTINIFSNNVNWLNQLVTDLGDNAYEFAEPENHNVTTYLLDNPSHEITNRKDDFQYKVKTKFTRKSFKSFGNWCTTAQNIKISKQFLDELLSDQSLYEGRTIYVKDEKTLNIVTLFIGEGIQSIVKLVKLQDLDI